MVGDLGDKESLHSALLGIQRAFLLNNSSEAAETLQSNFVYAALVSGVKHVVKLSQFAADLNSPLPYGQSPELSR